MLTIVRFVGRRLLLSQSKKFQLIRRVVAIVGVAKVVTRVVTPVRQIVLARDESMEIRITKNGQQPS
jgi:hypothetical protein